MSRFHANEHLRQCTEFSRIFLVVFLKRPSLKSRNYGFLTFASQQLNKWMNLVNVGQNEIDTSFQRAPDSSERVCVNDMLSTNSASKCSLVAACVLQQREHIRSKCKKRRHLIERLLVFPFVALVAIMVTDKSVVLQEVN